MSKNSREPTQHDAYCPHFGSKVDHPGLCADHPGYPALSENSEPLDVSLLMSFWATVFDAGGGIVTLLVDRNTPSYPPKDGRVRVFYSRSGEELREYLAKLYGVAP